MSTYRPGFIVYLNKNVGICRLRISSTFKTLIAFDKAIACHWVIIRHCYRRKPFYAVASSHGNAVDARHSLDPKRDYFWFCLSRVKTTVLLGLVACNVTP